MTDEMKTVTVALTGASGAQYGLRLIECLIAANCTVYVLVSKAAQMVIATETDVKLPAKTAAMEVFLQDLFDARPDQLRVFGREDWMSPVASGSGAMSAMVICPCSTGTLSAVATGASNNLIERAADVALKERRQLIVVLRETPYSNIHLENMLTLSQAGATIMPASPGFYQNPTSVSDMVDFMVARILNHLDIEHSLMPAWGQDKA